MMVETTIQAVLDKTTIIIMNKMITTILDRTTTIRITIATRTTTTMAGIATLNHLNGITHHRNHPAIIGVHQHRHRPWS